MNNLIIDKLKEIKQLQSLIKLNALGYRTKKMEEIVISVSIHYL